MTRPLIFLFMLSCFFSFSQQLSYKPINPFFGGDTFNYQQLLASAEAQNSFTDPNALDDEQTEFEEFQEGLNRQVLDQISRSLLTTQLGGELQEGTFTIGDLSLEIFNSAEGLVINILDTRTGEQTQVIVPN